MGELRFGTVLDQYGLPVAGALVTIRDSESALVDFGADNPIITDSTGYWEAELDQGVYSLVISKGDDSVTRTLEICADANLVRRGLGYIELNSYPTQEAFRIATKSYPLASLTELSVDVGLRASSRVFTTCTIA